MVTRKPASKKTKRRDRLPKVGDSSAKAIGMRIRYVRREQDRTIEEVAAAIGISPDKLRAIENGKYPAELMLGIESKRIIQSYKHGEKLTVKSPPKKFLIEIGRRIRHARECRGIPTLYAALTIHVQPADWIAFEDGKKEPTAHEGLAISILLNVDPFWLGHFPTHVTAKRIDQIKYDKGPPATIRELLSLCRALEANPYELNWGDTEKPTAKLA